MGRSRRGSSRDSEERSTLRLSLSMRARRAVRGRNAPINRRRDVGRRIFSLALLLVILSLSFLASPRRHRCVREGGIIEIARRRVQQTRKGKTSGDLSTSSYRSATPLRAFPPFPHDPPLPWGIHSCPTTLVFFYLLLFYYQKYGRNRNICTRYFSHLI